MKNLKKALSMVLASAMLFGMMVVGTGAAHADVTAEHNEEAIAVVSAAGIMGANEEFNPDKLITRNEMAVVMVNMLGLDTEDFAGASTFTDVPAWAADYVDACYANKIVSGVSATEYNGSANVTTAEAALMMMKALGYFQYASDFSNDWMLATIKQASKIDLLDGIDAKANAPMTRNEVAQLALNALEADVVDVWAAGTEATVIKTNDIDITIPGEPAVYAVKSAKAGIEYDSTDDGDEDDDDTSLQLIEQLYEDDFTKRDAADLYGRAGYEWLNDDGDRVVLTCEAADYVLLATEDTTLFDLIEEKKLDKKIDLEAAANSAKDYTLIPGETVELWVNKDGVITADLCYIYAEAEITDVEEMDEDLDADRIEAGAKYWVELTVGNTATKYMDIQFDNFDAKTYVKGAYVLTVVKINSFTNMQNYSAVSVHDVVDFGDLEDVFVWVDTAIADQAQGKITSKGSNYVKIDNVKFKNSRITGATLGEEYIFIEDVNGVLINYIEIEEAETKLDDVYYVVNTYNDGGKKDAYGTTTTTTYAQIMNMAGEVKDVVVATTVGQHQANLDDGDFGIVMTDSAIGSFVTVKEYTSKKHVDTNNDNVADTYFKNCAHLIAWADGADYEVFTVAQDTAVTTDTKKVNFTVGQETVVTRFGSDLNYILVKGENADVETSVKTGLQNITLKANTKVITKVDADGNYVAIYAIVPAGVFGATEYDDVIYVKAATYASQEKTQITVDGELKTVSILTTYNEKGEKVEMYVDVAAANDALDNSNNAEAGFYTFSEKDGMYTMTDVGSYQANTAGQHRGSYTGKYGTEFTVNGQDFETEGAVWVDLHETDADLGAIYTNAIKSLSALDKAETVDNFVVTVYADKDGNAKVIVITDAQ